MKESMSNALILNLIIIFLFVLVILFVGSTSYTKAFKVKNRIVSILERNEVNIVQYGIGYEPIHSEIEAALSTVGYRVDNNNASKCRDAMAKRFEHTNYTYNVFSNKQSSYRYCVAEFYDPTSKMRGRYFAVITYMYFEVPLIGAHLEFPVYGETKTMGMAY